jgi:hydrogenase/urease accessory protein HupE
MKRASSSFITQDKVSIMRKFIFAVLSSILFMVAIPILESLGLLPASVSAFIRNNMVAIAVTGILFGLLVVGLPFIMPKIMDMRSRKK